MMLEVCRVPDMLTRWGDDKTLPLQYFYYCHRLGLWSQRNKILQCFLLDSASGTHRCVSFWKKWMIPSISSTMKVATELYSPSSQSTCCVVSCVLSARWGYTIPLPHISDWLAHLSGHLPTTCSAASQPLAVFFLACLSLKMKALKFSKMSGAIRSRAWCHIPEDINSQHHHCETLRFAGYIDEEFRFCWPFVL